MKRAFAVAAAIGAVPLALVGNASALADERASCIGIGSSIEAGKPGVRAAGSHFVKEFHDELGFESPGAFFAFFAKQHAGSEPACFGGLGQ